MSDPHPPQDTNIKPDTPASPTDITTPSSVTSDPHGHEHAPAGAPSLPFSDTDWHEFHQSDKGAGGAIIVLMGSIFSIGLVLYTIIAIVVAQ